MNTSHEIGIVICNWNKKNYILNCINSVLNSSFKDLFIYVIDNASTDGSVQAIIEQQYPDNVHLICNEQNLGGSGGFNTGIRLALKNKHKYLMLLDNDVVLDFNTILNAYDYLEHNNHVDVLGSKLFQMDKPDRLQEMGATINWTSCLHQPLYAGIRDREDLPDIVECDYVPACAVLIRSRIINKVGLMDEDNFIYWDDIEWFHRMKTSGARIISYGKSKAWHKMGVKERNNTFGSYYFQRNRINFFIHNLPDKILEQGIKILFKDLFQAIYFSRYKKQFNTARTLQYAINDALNGIRGQAADNRILIREPDENRFKHWLNGVQKLIIICHPDNKITHSVINNIQNFHPDLNLILYGNDKSKHEIEYEFGLPTTETISLEGYHSCQICEQITQVRDKLNNNISCYVDSYFNVIISRADREMLMRYDVLLKKYFQRYFNDILLQIRQLRNRMEHISYKNINFSGSDM